MISQVLINILIFAVSGLAFWMASRLRRDARQSRDWPVLQGRIVERGVESMQSDARSFMPKVKYAYTVAGKEYVGQQVYRTGRVGSLEKAAKKLADGLPDPIPVHYNPQDPNEAFLLSDPAWIYWTTLVFGIGAFVWGTLQLLTLLV